MKQLMIREMRALKLSALVATGGLLALLLLEGLLADSPRHDLAVNGLWYYALPLMSLAIGCRLIARERSQREIEFSHSWPVTRPQMWAAKLIAGLLVTGAVYVVVMGVALALPGSWLLRHILSPGEMTAPAVVLEHLAPMVVLFGIGLQEALLWGTVAALLNFAPYVGPLIGVALMLLMAAQSTLLLELLTKQSQ